jgi:TolB protein
VSRGRALGIVLAALAAVSAGAASSLSSDAGIVFSRGATPDRYDLWTMAPNGTLARRVTKSCMWDRWPAWSPDKQRIAFARSCGGKFRIFVVNADGSGLRAVTPARLNAEWPAWSPDGRRLAFSGGAFEREEIYVIDVDGAGLRRLTHNTVADRSPDWSPDGKAILFTRARANGPSDMMVLSPSGKSSARPVGVRGGEPAWSPDGRRIAFARRDRSIPQETVDIWVVRADGRGARQVTDERPGVVSHHPAWSPDGKRIAFMSNRIERKNGGSIYIAGAEGVYRVAKSPMEDVDPAWTAP